MFISQLSIIAETWKKPRCPSIDKLWYIHRREYDSVIKRNELSGHEKTWNNLKYLLLSKKVKMKSLGKRIMHAHGLSRVWLYSPKDCSPPGSSVNEIYQARILEWIAIFYSRGSSQPKDQTQDSWVSWTGRQILYHWATLEAPGKTTETVKWSVGLRGVRLVAKRKG